MTAEEFHVAAKERYWKGKDLPAARKLMEEGIEQARTEVDAAKEKAMNFDLASFCWPGWDEAGIEITPKDLARGDRAAQENLRLAKLLGKGPKPTANAWFMIGAFDLAMGRIETASESFNRFLLCAQEAGESDMALLAEGYREMVSRSNSSSNWESILAQLEAHGETGGEFAEQLRTAARVFGRAS